MAARCCTWPSARPPASRRCWRPAVFAGFGLAARLLGQGADPYRLAGFGALAGLLAFSAVIFAAPLQSLCCSPSARALIGFGGRIVRPLHADRRHGDCAQGPDGLALGDVGRGAGLGRRLGGRGRRLIRDGVGSLAENGWLGQAMADPATGYSVVYHIEIALLFATLIAIGPLVRISPPTGWLPCPPRLRSLALSKYPDPVPNSDR